MLWSVFVKGLKYPLFDPLAHIGVFIQEYGVPLSSAIMAWRCLLSLAHCCLSTCSHQ